MSHNNLSRSKFITLCLLVYPSPYTPLTLYTPLYPIYPSPYIPLTLYIPHPIYPSPYIPLNIPLYLHIPIYLIYFSILLYIPLYPYTLLYTPLYSYIPLYNPIPTFRVFPRKKCRVIMLALALTHFFHSTLDLFKSFSNLKRLPSQICILIYVHIV